MTPSVGNAENDTMKMSLRVSCEIQGDKTNLGCYQEVTSRNREKENKFLLLRFKIIFKQNFCICKSYYGRINQNYGSMLKGM